MKVVLGGKGDKVNALSKWTAMLSNYIFQSQNQIDIPYGNCQKGTARACSVSPSLWRHVMYCIPHRWFRQGHIHLARETVGEKGAVRRA